MLHTRNRKAFTLIELLTVMAIIVILIGILTPALSAARNRATTTAIRAQINAMSVGLEAFRNDQGEYVPSNAALYNDTMAWEVGTVGAGMNELNGAHLLVDAMVGRDFLGYDSRKTTSTYDRWDPRNDRRQPYIPVDGVDVTSDINPARDADGVIPGITRPQPTGSEVPVPVFRDKFGWPILYYRAAPTANQNTPMIQTTTGLPIGDGIYFGWDNDLFTSYAGATHAIADATSPLQALCGSGGYPSDSLEPPPPGNPTPTATRFAEFIRSIRATTLIPATGNIDCPRPVKSDSFIILSPGRDGKYGTQDDVSNFEVFSTQR
ncbi:MAG: type II secretion system protein [Phycisphaerales bacterium]|nr:type II secretion system protein [Phycisphaerales bacterium]